MIHFDIVRLCSEVCPLLTLRDVQSHLERVGGPKRQQAERQLLAEEIYRFLTTDSRISDMDTRVGAVKCLLALMPDSREELRKLILGTTYPLHGEVHFSIFCFADELADFVDPMEYVQFIEMVGDYIVRTESNVSEALWMAGHFLGGHCNDPLAIGVLVSAARRARYVNGRLSAVDGLTESYERTQEAQRRHEILSVLRDVSTNDRSSTVRLVARESLSRLRKKRGRTR